MRTKHLCASLNVTVGVFLAIVETELDRKKHLELRTFELDQALKKPKTTVVELRAFERCMWNSILHIVLIS